MKKIIKNCGTCAYLDNGKMCNICNVIFFSHWAPNMETKLLLKYQEKSHRNLPKKRKNAFAKYRSENHFTQKHLSKKLNIPEATICDRIKGKPMVNLEKAIDISEKTHIPIIDLFFPTEFLEEHGLTRDEVISGIKHENL